MRLVASTRGWRSDHPDACGGGPPHPSLSATPDYALNPPRTQRAADNRPVSDGGVDGAGRSSGAVAGRGALWAVTSRRGCEERASAARGATRAIAILLGEAVPGTVISSRRPIHIAAVSTSLLTGEGRRSWPSGRPGRSPGRRCRAWRSLAVMPVMRSAPSRITIAAQTAKVSR